jgi:hypothetical protein
LRSPILFKDPVDTSASVLHVATDSTSQHEIRIALDKNLNTICHIPARLTLEKTCLQVIKRSHGRIMQSQDAFSDDDSSAIQILLLGHSLMFLERIDWDICLLACLQITQALEREKETRGLVNFIHMDGMESYSSKQGHVDCVWVVEVILIGEGQLQVLRRMRFVKAILKVSFSEPLDESRISYLNLREDDHGWDRSERPNNLLCNMCLRAGMFEHCGGMDYKRPLTFPLADPPWKVLIHGALNTSIGTKHEDTCYSYNKRV